MSMRQVYGCNICRDEEPISMQRDQLIGIVFKTNKAFSLGRPSETDGVHICFRCAGQLRAQLPSYPLTPRESES